MADNDDLTAKFERKLKQRLHGSINMMTFEQTEAAREVFAELAGDLRTPDTEQRREEMIRDLASADQGWHFMDDTVPDDRDHIAAVAASLITVGWRKQPAAQDPVAPDTGQRDARITVKMREQNEALKNRVRDLIAANQGLQAQLAAAQAPAASKGKTIVFGPGDEVTICGARVEQLRLGWALCPLPAGHSGDHVPEAPAASEIRTLPDVQAEAERRWPSGHLDASVRNIRSGARDGFITGVMETQEADRGLLATPASGDTIEQAARVIAEGFFATQPLRCQLWDEMDEGIKDNNRIRARALTARGLLADGTDRRRIADAVATELERIKQEIHDEGALAVYSAMDVEMRLDAAAGELRAALTDTTEEP